MPFEKLSRIRWLGLCSQHKSEDIELWTKRQQKSRGTKTDGHEEDGRWSWGKYKNVITTQTSKMKNITLVQQLDQLNKSTCKDRHDI